MSTSPPASFQWYNPRRAIARLSQRTRDCWKNCAHRQMDPDFKDPHTEAQSISNALHSQVVKVPETGHYPQSQRPDSTTAAIVRFMSEVTHGA